MSTTYDILLDSDGDLPAITRHRNDVYVTMQRIEIRLSTWLGEWMLDRRAGLDFDGLFQQKPPRVEEFGALIRREVETTPGVLRVEDFTGAFSGTELSYSGNVIFQDRTEAEIRVTPLGDAGANQSSMVLFLPVSNAVIGGL